MTDISITLCERIKRLGYAQDRQVALYGEVFDLLSDPFSIGEGVIFVDARERRSGRERRVRVPINIVHMAKQDLSRHS
jgi:hypothetical protein